MKKYSFHIQDYYEGRSFIVAAPALWNSLSLPVRQAKEIDSFKCVVKALFYKIWTTILTLLDYQWNRILL